ncbi:MAG: oligosaccharide flippase family protein [Bacteroidales bacterium]|nr:oligosaccharide flippase family protein [Bacteroidales bacterium]
MWGFLSKGVEGLITGAIFGQLVHNIILIVKSGKHFIKYRFTIKELQRSAVRFKKFPIYNLPSEFFNFISARLPIFMLPIFFDSAIVGLYSMPFKYLFVPLNLLGVSIRTPDLSQIKLSQIYKLISDLFREILFHCHLKFDIFLLPLYYLWD